MLRPYLRVVRTPGVVGPFLFTFLGSLPISMLGLGVLLLVRSATGSIALAGIASGAFSIGNAAGLLLQGRLFDRHGQTVVLVSTGLGCGVCSALLVPTAGDRHLFHVTVILSALSGALIPGVITSLRVLIPRVVSDPVDRTAAYALLGTQFAVAMITGPLLISALLVIADAALAVFVGAVLVVVASLSFASTGASRAWRPAVRARERAPRWELSKGFGALLVASLAGGLGGGLTTVGITAASGGAALAGLLFAALSAGDLVGGIVYGSRSWRTPAWHRLVFCQLLTVAAQAILAVLCVRPILMLPGLFLLGGTHSPAAIVKSALLDDVVHKGHLGRAYTSVVAAGLLGMAVGTAAGGRLIDATGQAWAAFAVASATMLVVAWWVRRSAGRRDGPARTP